MFGWFKKKPSLPPAGEEIVHQLPGDEFSWPKRWQLTVLDEARIAIPASIVGETEVFGSVIHCPDDVRLTLPMESHSTPGAQIILWLKPGQAAWLSKSCQAVILPQRKGDKRKRRFRLSKVA